MNPIEQRVRELLAPILEREQLSLYDVEAGGAGRGRQLRVFIDRAGGVNLGHCEAVSHQLSAILDVEDLFGDSHTLEVSSPGLTRRLVKEEHFEKSLGCFVRIVFRKGFAGPDKAFGTLARAETPGRYRVAWKDSSPPVEFSFGDVGRAKLDLEP